jgi:DNA-binding transcriptional LysR family regulator
MNPNLSHFETFMVVAEKQSFSLTAQELYVTKAAISNAIKTLEAELKVPLFIRTTRQVSLTEEGKILYKQCEKLKEELDNTRNIISHFHDKPQGKLRVNCNSQLTETYLLPVLNKYMSLFPDVKVEVVIDERMPDFKNENIDISVGVNWPAPDNIIARKIGETHYVLCASPEYLSKFGVPLSLFNLTEHKFILHTGRDKNNPIVSLKDKNIQVRVNSYLSANNIAFMKKCVLSGYGIAQFHEYVISNELQTGALIEILSKFLKPSEPLYLYYQKNRYVQPKVRQLVNLFMENDG